MDVESRPTAKFLQARINALTRTMLTRLTAMIRLAEEDEYDPKEPKIPTLVDTATEQVRLDVESTALVKAAEEFMVLTRSFKDLWLFGSLDTLKDGNEAGDGINAETEKNTRMQDDARIVAEAIQKLLIARGKNDEVEIKDQEMKDASSETSS